VRFSPFNFLRSRRGVAAVVALVLILFLFRPGVYRLRNRISNTIGSALGRRVSIDSVHFHLLPRPGFALEGLVVYDDPEFSPEPMIRAPEVSAAIRFRSLLRGRLEIATLSATDPSINLVRSGNGRWNLASLVERNAQIPAAPTGKPASERRPVFPYLEATGARINFKLGQTKKSYALMDADVALWQDSENSWAARLKAEPVRTDFNLTDTGLIQINATWQRASSLQSTPVQIAAQWKNGQLGQITTLLTGKDRGWRGGVTFTANLSGTPEALRIESQTVIDGFRRYDIADSENVRLAAVCSGQYNTVTSTLANLLCESPVSGGTVRLRGNLNVAPAAPAYDLTTHDLTTYDLTLEADKVPLASVVRLLRQGKKQIPADLTASGLLNAQFRATRGFSADRRRGLTTRWTGNGSATNVRLSPNAADEVDLGTVPLTLTDSLGAKIRRPRTQDKEQEPAEPHVRIGPVALTMNTSAPVDAGGWISAAGYRFFLRGDMELKDLFRLENDLGVPVARPAAEGAAKLDVSVSGPWQGFVPLTTLGTAQLRNVRAEVRGLNTPIEIASATLSLAPDAARMDKISARTGSTHWSGDVTASRHCAVPPCAFQFDFIADQLSAGDLAEWFTPHPAKRPWYRILNPSPTSNSDNARGLSPLLAVQAHGNLQVGRFGLKKVVATQVATQVDVDRGKITLTALRGQLLQGSHQGNWMIDLSNRDVSARDASSPPVRYRGAGALHDISLAQVSALTSTSTNDPWITGTADGKFDLQGSADAFRELLTRSDGNLQFVMRNGSLPRIKIPGSPTPLPVHRFSGDLRLTEGAWELSAGRLESRDGFYRVRGTASPAHGFDFVLTRGDERSWNLTGTLAKPHVAAADPAETKRADTDAKGAKP